MSRRSVAFVAIVAAAGIAAPALAAPKTVSGKYPATTTAADPTPFATDAGNCMPALAQAKHEQKINLPAPGTLVVDLSGFQGDWDLAVLNSKGQKLGDSAQDVASEPIDKPEKVKLKIKSKGTYIIRACNFAGGPTANVNWVHTYTA